MKRKLYILTLLLCGCLGGSAFAQIRDIALTAGVNAPLYKEAESGVLFQLNYGRFTRSGFGFRLGVQWTPDVADVDNVFGVPVALAYRTKARSGAERLVSGAVGAIGAVGYDAIDGDRNEDMLRDAVGGFLLNLFRDMEFSVGATPGRIHGESNSVTRASWGEDMQYWEESWTEKKQDTFLSLDAGLSLNYSLWRFDIKVMPAIHYYLTDSLVYHTSTGENGVGVTSTREQPLRWFFTFSGGLAFRF
ncbi:MAG: hypothetical protein IJ578_06725 [Bacteroidales bacterium]|nr:hypothetical protein [Bacteroidales bacterium]